MDPYGGLEADGSGSLDPITDDDEFDWPYRTDNGPATVADWWETTDCRVMRIAVGQDNDYLDPAVEADANANPPVVAKDAETSEGGFCGHFPGSSQIPTDGEPISVAAQTRVEEVGMALLGLNRPGRPSFNEPATGTPTISGVAQVGSTLTADLGSIADADETENAVFHSTGGTNLNRWAKK